MRGGFVVWFYSSLLRRTTIFLRLLLHTLPNTIEMLVTAHEGYKFSFDVHFSPRFVAKCLKVWHVLWTRRVFKACRASRRFTKRSEMGAVEGKGFSLLSARKSQWNNKLFSDILPFLSDFVEFPSVASLLLTNSFASVFCPSSYFLLERCTSSNMFLRTFLFSSSVLQGL